VPRPTRVAQACALLGSPLLTNGEEPRPLPSVLPYAVGLGTPLAEVPSGKLSWRRLRGACIRSNMGDSALGFTALGLPPGFVGCAVASRSWVVRPALGSAAAHKLSHAEILGRHRRVKEAQGIRKMERERARNLADLERSYATARVAWPPPWRPGGPFADFKGALRGHCARCNACPGFDSPQMAGVSHGPAIDVCVHCGCGSMHHEKLWSDQDRKAEAADDILA